MLSGKPNKENKVIIKNLTTADLPIDDLGLTIPASGSYDLSSTSEYQISQSDNLLDKVVDGSLVTIRQENPELLFTRNETIQLISKGSLVSTKTAMSGESVTINENNGHLRDNTVVNWTLEKYLSSDSSYSERLVIPFNHILTINQFLGGSSNVPTYLALDWMYWNEDVQEFQRVNPEVRLEESYVALTSAPVMSGNDVIEINNTGDRVDDIQDIEVGLGYLFECTNVHHRANVTAIDYINNTITISPPIPAGGAIINARISLVDRAIAQNGNQISSSSISWTSPPRLQGDGKSYLRITTTNEDDSEPGVVTAMLNGWIEPGLIGS